MAILAFLKENASSIAAIFSVLGVLIGYGNYRLNMATTTFQMGTNPIFEPDAEPVEEHPGWWRITITVRNRATSTLVVESVSVPRWRRWRRWRLAPMPDDRATPALSAIEAARHIEISTQVMPKDKSIEILGRTWHSDTSAIVFFLYCPRPPCRLLISWRSKASTRLRRSEIVV